MTSYTGRSRTTRCMVLHTHIIIRWGCMPPSGMPTTGQRKAGGSRLTGHRRHSQHTSGTTGPSHAPHLATILCACQVPVGSASSWMSRGNSNWHRWTLITRFMITAKIPRGTRMDPLLRSAGYRPSDSTSRQRGWGMYFMIQQFSIILFKMNSAFNVLFIVLKRSHTSEIGCI